MTFMELVYKRWVNETVLRGARVRVDFFTFIVIHGIVFMWECVAPRTSSTFGTENNAIRYTLAQLQNVAPEQHQSAINLCIFFFL